jgi:GntR family transcriptional regulator
MNQEPHVPLEKSRADHRQVADLMRTAIEQGEYAPGERLPSEPELAAKYGVQRPTINRAMLLLRGEGLVKVDRGRGSYVTQIPVIRRNAITRYSKQAREREGARGAFDGEVKALGLTPRTETEVARVVPLARVAEALALPEPEMQVIARRRKMYADDTPVQLAVSYIPLDIGEDTALERADSGPGGIISRFEELGHKQVGITEQVSVRRPTDEEEEFLRLEPDEPVMEIWHTGYDAKDRAVEICVHSIPAYRWVLDYAWPTM